MNYDTLPAAPEPSQVEKAEALLKRVKADEKRARKIAREKKRGRATRWAPSPPTTWRRAPRASPPPSSC
jgi:hypothetical protein